jgi:hypothetical protein
VANTKTTNILRRSTRLLVGEAILGSLGHPFLRVANTKNILIVLFSTFALFVMEQPRFEHDNSDDATTDTERDLDEFEVGVLSDNSMLVEQEAVEQDAADSVVESSVMEPDGNDATSNSDTEDDEDDEDYVLDERKKSPSNPLCLFTTGLGFSADDKREMKAVIESAASKNKFCATFTADSTLLCLVYRWARKPSFNFAADILNSIHVVARSVGLESAFQLCYLRGWIVTRRSSTSSFPHIEYKRFHECLKKADFPPNHRALHLNGIVQSAYDSFGTSVLPLPAPAVAPIKKRQSTKSPAKPLSRAKKRKSVLASPHFELIHTHDANSFGQRLTQNTKCLQIALFLDGRCKWSEIPDSKETSNGIIYRCIVLPTIVARDFWLSPAVHIITEMKLLGVAEDKLFDLILLGAYQTSWFRFFYIGMSMVRDKKIADPFKTYIQLAEEAFGSITGGPKPRADPPGIVDIKDVYYPDECKFKSQVVGCVRVLLELVNETPVEEFSHGFVRENVLRTAAEITSIKSGAELGEFRLMLILQICALSSVVLHPSPKLLNLLYPIPGKGSANHLNAVGVKEADHHDALRRVSYHFGLKEFGDNGGESLLCETLPGRNVFDAFFPEQSLFLLDAHGKPMAKKYATTKWTALEEEDKLDNENSDSDTDA